MQFGGTNQGAAPNVLMHTTADADIVKFLYIEHTGKRDDGTTNNLADSVYLCFDASAAANDSAVCIEIGPNETWFAKLNCPLTSLHCISGQVSKAGTGSNTVQCIVAAMIDNV